MNMLVSTLLIVAATAPFAFIGLAFAPARRFGWAALFLGLLAVDALVTGVPGRFGLNPAGAEWNWAGKIFSLAWAVAFVYFGPLRWKEVGATWRQRPGSMIPAALVTVAVMAFIAFMLDAPQRTDPETLAFQATMPGLAEELAYRGVFFALLVRAFESGREASGGALVYATVVTALAFGLLHGLHYSAGQVHFDVMAFAFPFLGGLVFGWMRAYTGSLLFPVLAHNGANLVVYLVP
jgi:uncharacterized protein